MRYKLECGHLNAMLWRRLSGCQSVTHHEHQTTALDKHRSENNAKLISTLAETEERKAMLTGRKLKPPC